jgi:hypothetical protein
MSTTHNKFEDIFQMAKTSEESMDILIQNLESLSLLFQSTPHTRQEEQESFIGISILQNVQVHSSSDIRSKGKCKRILGHADKNKSHPNSGPRKCTTCRVVGHEGGIVQRKMHTMLKGPNFVYTIHFLSAKYVAILIFCGGDIIQS